MARYLTAAETKAEHLALGPELGPVYHELWNECAWLHLKWRQFQQLFGSSEERVEILNDAASLFFRVVQDSLWDDILLHLSALTDPPDSGKGKENLTVQRLPPLIVDSEVRGKVQAAVDCAVAATSFARSSRNRRIAHRDLLLAISPTARPLEPASRKDVREAVASLCEVIRQTSIGCTGADVYFADLAEPNDALSMLYVLRDGLEADRARRHRLSSGSPTPDDLGPPRAL